MKCHQRQIREKMAETPLSDESERRAAATFDNASIREIPIEEAKPVILDYEWLGNIGTTRFAVGLFFGEYLAGVACFGNTAGSMVTRSICGPEHAAEVLTLVRGTCVHWAPEHAASYLINKACAFVSKKYGFSIFIAYSDTDAGEVGTVYQASNWLYAGKGEAPTIYKHPDGRQKDSRCISVMTRSRKGRPKRGSPQPVMDEWVEKMRAEGRIVRPGKTPWVKTMTNEQARQKLIAEGFVQTKGTSKHRYVHFVGDKRTLRALRKALKLSVLPYPKRDAAQSKDDAVGTTNGI